MEKNECIISQERDKIGLALVKSALEYEEIFTVDTIIQNQIYNVLNKDKKLVASYYSFIDDITTLLENRIHSGLSSKIKFDDNEIENQEIKDTLNSIFHDPEIKKLKGKELVNTVIKKGLRYSSNVQTPQLMNTLLQGIKDQLAEKEKTDEFNSLMFRIVDFDSLVDKVKKNIKNTNNSTSMRARTSTFTSASRTEVATNPTVQYLVIDNEKAQDSNYSPFESKDASKSRVVMSEEAIGRAEAASQSDTLFLFPDNADHSGGSESTSINGNTITYAKQPKGTNHPTHLRGLHNSFGIGVRKHSERFHIDLNEALKNNGIDLGNDSLFKSFEKINFPKLNDERYKDQSLMFKNIPLKGKTLEGAIDAAKRTSTIGKSYKNNQSVRNLPTSKEGREIWNKYQKLVDESSENEIRWSTEDIDEYFYHEIIKPLVKMLIDSGYADSSLEKFKEKTKGQIAYVDVTKRTNTYNYALNNIVRALCEEFGTKFYNTEVNKQTTTYNDDTDINEFKAAIKEDFKNLAILMAQKNPDGSFKYKRLVITKGGLLRETGINENSNPKLYKIFMEEYKKFIERVMEMNPDSLKSVNASNIKFPTFNGLSELNSKEKNWEFPTSTKVGDRGIKSLRNLPNVHSFSFKNAQGEWITDEDFQIFKLQVENVIAAVYASNRKVKIYKNSIKDLQEELNKLPPEVQEQMQECIKYFKNRMKYLTSDLYMHKSVFNTAPRTSIAYKQIDSTFSAFKRKTLAMNIATRFNVFLNLNYKKVIDEYNSEIANAQTEEKRKVLEAERDSLTPYKALKQIVGDRSIIVVANRIKKYYKNLIPKDLEGDELIEAVRKKIIDNYIKKNHKVNEDGTTSPNNKRCLSRQELEQKCIQERWAENLIEDVPKMLQDDNFEFLFEEACPLIREQCDINIDFSAEYFHEHGITFSEIGSNGTLKVNGELMAKEEMQKDSWQIIDREISSKSSLTQDVKAAISTVYKTEGDKYFYNCYGDREFLNPNYVHGLLIKELRECETMSEMTTVLKDLRVVKPWLQDFIRKINLPNNSALKNQFFRCYRKDFNNLSIQTYQKDGNGKVRIHSFIVNKSSGAYALIDEWRDNIANGNVLNSELSLYTKEGNTISNKIKVNGEYQVNPIITTLRTKLFDVKHRNSKRGSKIDVDTLASNWNDLQELSDIIKAFGIEISPQELLAFLSITDKEDFSNNKAINGIIDRLFNILNGLESGRSEYSVETEGDTEVKISRDLINAFSSAYSYIGKQLSIISDYAIESSIRQGDKTLYSHTNPNFLNHMLRRVRRSVGALALLNEHTEVSKNDRTYDNLSAKERRDKVIKEELTKEQQEYIEWFEDSFKAEWYHELDENGEYATREDGSYIYQIDLLNDIVTCPSVYEAKNLNLEYFVQLESDKVEFIDLNPSQVYLSLVGNFFNDYDDAGNKSDTYLQAMPIMSSTPSQEFIKLKKFQGDTIEEIQKNANEAIQKIIMQEYRRINLVLQRNDEYNKGTLTLKELIQNYDIIEKNPNGASFKFLSMLNDYYYKIKGSDKILSFVEILDYLNTKDANGIKPSSIEIEECIGNTPKSEKFESALSLKDFMYAVVDTLLDSEFEKQYKEYVKEGLADTAGNLFRYLPSSFISNAATKKIYLDILDAIKEHLPYTNELYSEFSKAISDYRYKKYLTEEESHNIYETLLKCLDEFSQIDGFDDKISFDYVNGSKEMSIKEAIELALEFMDKDLRAIKGGEKVNQFKDNARTPLKEFFLNNFYGNIQVIQLMGGDLSFYINAIDFQKRWKEVHAPGLMCNTEATFRGIDNAEKSIKEFDEFEGPLSVNNGTVFADGTYEKSVYFKDKNHISSNLKTTMEILRNDFINQNQFKDDPNAAEKIEELVNAMAKAFKKVNATDAQSYRSLDSYRKICIMNGTWGGPEGPNERFYQKYLQYIKSLENGNPEQFVFEPSDLNALFQVIKPFTYGASEYNYKDANGKEHNMQLYSQHKNSEFPIFTILSAAAGMLGQSQEMAALNLFMHRNHIDVVHFSTAVKIGQQGLVDYDKLIEEHYARTPKSSKSIGEHTSLLTDLLSNEIYTEEGSYKIDPTKVHAIHYSRYVIQMETPNHGVNAEIAIGSQFKKLISSDISDDAIVASEAFEEMIKKWNKDGVINLLGEDSDSSRALIYRWKKDEHGNKVEKIPTTIKELMGYRDPNNPNTKTHDIGLTKEETINMFNEIFTELIMRQFKHLKDRFSSIEELAAVLQDQIKKEANFDRELLKACTIDPQTGTFMLPLYDPIQTTRIQQLLSSIIKKNIIKQEVQGGGLYQVSNFGYDDKLQVKYEYKNEEGKHIELSRDYFRKNIYKGDGSNFEEAFMDFVNEGLKSKKVSIKEYECYLPAYLREFYESLMDENGYVDINKKNADGTYILSEELREAICYRVPTENKYSMIPLKIKGFLPIQNGSSIMLPKEITAITGADFDIDKMYCIFKYIDKIKRSGDKEFLREVIGIKDGKEVNRIFREVLSQQTAEDVENKKDREIYKKWKKRDAKYRIIHIEPKRYDFSKNIEENDTESIKNLLLDLSRSILTNSDTASRMQTAGNFESLKTAANIRTITQSYDSYSLIRRLQEMGMTDVKLSNIYSKLKSLDPKSFEELLDNANNLNICLPSTYVLFHKQNFVAGKLIGMYANHSVSHAVVQNTNLSINDSEKYTIAISIEGNRNISLHSIRNSKGQYISSLISEWTAASVDDVKEGVLGRLNQNVLTADVTMYLARLGYDSECISLFLNQPAVIKAVEYAQKNNCSLQQAVYKIADIYYAKQGILEYGTESSFDNDLYSYKNINRIQDFRFEDLFLCQLNGDLIEEYVSNYDITNFAKDIDTSDLDEQIEKAEGIEKKRLRRLKLVKTLATESKNKGINFKEDYSELFQDPSSNVIMHNYFQYQFHILKKLQKIITGAKALGDLTQALRADTYGGAAGPSFADTMAKIDTLSSFYKKMNIQGEESPLKGYRGIIDDDINIGNYLSESKNENEANDYKKLKFDILKQSSPLIQSCYTLGLKSTEFLFGKYFPQLNSNIFYMSEALKAYTTIERLDPDLLNLMIADYFTFQVTSLPFFGTTLEKDSDRDLYKQKRMYFIHKFPEYFNEMISKYPDLKNNEFIQRIKREKPNDKVPVSVEKFRNVGTIDFTLQDLYTKGWESLLYDSNKDIVNFGFNLFLYGFFRNGLSFGPNVYTSLAPVLLRANIPGYREVLENLSKSTQLFSSVEDIKPGTTEYKFLMQFIRNHLQNYQVAKYITDESTRALFNGEEEIKIVGPTLAHSEIMKHPYSQSESFEPIRTIHSKVGESDVFYMLDMSKSSIAKKSTDSTLYYHIINPLGLQYNFKEYDYYGNEDMSSVLPIENDEVEKILKIKGSESDIAVFNFDYMIDNMDEDMDFNSIIVESIKETFGLDINDNVIKYNPSEQVIQELNKLEYTSIFKDEKGLKICR